MVYSKSSSTGTGSATFATLLPSVTGVSGKMDMRVSDGCSDTGGLYALPSGRR